MSEKLKILIVEDDPNDRDLLLYHLRKNLGDFQSVVVETDEHFREQLLSLRPDIILSDYALPTFDGVRAFKIKQELAPAIPFIIVSGTVGEERAVELIRDGVTDYVLKDKVFSLPPRIHRAIRESREKEQKRVAVEDLRRSERRLARAQEVAHLGSWEMDIDTGTSIWSDEVCRIYGLDPCESHQSLRSFVTYVYPADRYFVLRQITEMRDTHRDTSFHYRIVRPDGVVRTLYSEARFEHNAEDAPISLYGIVHDVTKIKAAEEKVLHLNAELEERVVLRTAELQASNDQLEAFTYTVSHDLRSPLQIINGYSSIFARQYGQDLNEDAMSLLEGIKTSTRHMSQLIDDLLKFAKLGRTELVRGPLDMNEIVEAAITELTLSGKMKYGEHIECNLKPAMGDRNLIYQVWVNLISNAVKYSRKVEKPVIEIGMREIGGEDVYYICDNGEGFDMKYYDKLFGVFQRLHRSSDFEGTGVGLALVHSIIQRHGGRVWAEGKVKEGATFYFTLPSSLSRLIES